MQYKEFTLDKFQEDAINAIERGNSVVVSAATGTGKTLVADYVIDKAIKEGVRAIYTAPIKALSNQKFREFKEAFGAERVGMMTGDVVINPTADVLIMTTEIYRNILLENTSEIDTVKYVVFDEIHFINDIERGTVWEESLIFSPDHVRFVCLSATIPNYKQFAEWISTIKGHTVETVNYMKRAVPLAHKFYDSILGITTMEAIRKDVKENKPQQMQGGFQKGRGGGGHGGRGRKPRIQTPSHIELVKELRDLKALPAIFFSFSRALCERRAKELSRKVGFSTPDERKEILEVYNNIITDQVRKLHSAQDLKGVLTRGIGVHHAGMLPKLKEIVEHLFDKGLLKVLYATETFAVGINMPAKSVCFGSLEKYDGISFRILNSKEYFQLAGRAGRRGIDKFGNSISMIDRNHPEQFEAITKLVTEDVEPINSQYNLSYNTVLNLIKNFDDEKIETVLKSNFGYFVKKQSQSQVRITQSFQNYVRTLEKLGFLEDKKITWKGNFATRVYTKELEVGELVFSEILMSMTEQQVAVTLASLIYEPRRLDNFDIKNVDVGPLLKKIKGNQFLEKRMKKLYIRRMQRFVLLWMSGKEFTELLKICNLAEGDIIRLFRQLIDICKQVKGSLLHMNTQPELVQKLENVIAKVDRDLVSVTL